MRAHLINVLRSSRRRTARGFTFVELLIVIGIIAVLIGILLPTLARARAQANRAACLSNIRQLGTGILMYCNESDGYFPTCAAADDGVAFMPYPEDWVHWQQNRDINDSAIAKFVGRGETLKHLLRCPSDSFEGRKPAPAAVPGQGPYRYSYNLNNSVGLNTRGAWGRTKINQWRSPSRKILLTEVAEDISTSGAWSRSRLTQRHGTGISRGGGTPGTPAGRRIGINVSALFFDGHAESTDEDYARRNLFHGRPDSE
jgi:prepilin-type N-terminal cleavage/methylation domain-containing protein